MYNDFYPLLFLASQANKDILYFYEATKAKDLDCFKNAIIEEIFSFKKEKIFSIIPLNQKLSHKSLIPFMLVFKYEHNPLGDLLKYKARLCLNRAK